MEASAAAPTEEVVDGEDFFDDEYGDSASTYQEPSDPISEAIGTPGHAVNYVKDECFRTFPDGTWTDPERFDRFYWRPADPEYSGPAPILIDVLQHDTPAARDQEAVEKQVKFKRQFCANEGLAYVVLVQEEIDFGSAESVLLAIDAQAGKVEGTVQEADGSVTDTDADPAEPPQEATKRTKAARTPSKPARRRTQPQK